MKPHFHYRPGTWDQTVFNSVAIQNEYRLPARLRRGDIVVDIGMHIGSFCYAALSRGSRQVFGFEANPHNFVAASQNLKQFGKRVQVYQKAVWRSDRVVTHLSFSPNAVNNAAGHVLLPGGEFEVEALAFDDAMREITLEGRKRVRLLKIDCEGSEFPILLTSRTLHLIDSIVGEYHEYGPAGGPHVIPEQAQVAGYERFTVEVLTQVLCRAGFTIDAIQPHPDPTVSTGIFWASRTRDGFLGRLKARCGNYIARRHATTLP